MPDDESIHTVISDYMERVENLFVPGTAHAWTSYALDLHRFLVQKQGIKTIDELTRRDLDDYMVWVSNRHPGSTASAKLTFLTNFSKTLQTWEFTEDVLTEEFSHKMYSIDPNESMRTPNEEGVVKPFHSRDNIRKLWEHAPEPDRFRNETLIKFLWLTGVRRHEASRAQLDEIEKVPDRKVYRMKVRSLKTKKRRDDGRNQETMIVDGEKEQHTTWTIYFSDEFETQLNTWLNVYRPEYNGAADSPYLFLTNKSDRMSGNYINEIVKKAADAAGIQSVIGVDVMGRTHYHTTAHTIRHSFGTYIANRTPIKLIKLKHHMGHNDLETTQHYVHDDIQSRMNAFEGHTTRL